MKKMVVLALAGIIVGAGHARTVKEANFMRENPSGTNEFNRTFSQQESYNQTFAPKHFLGFEFGKRYENYSERLKLAHPFRLFDTIELYSSELGNLCMVRLEKKVENVKLESALEEIRKVSNLLRREYQIDFDHNENSYNFYNTYSVIEIECRTDYGRATALRLVIQNSAVEKRDHGEKLKSEIKGQTAIDIPADAGADLLSADEPNLDMTAKKEAEREQERGQREAAEQERARREAEREEERKAEAKRNADLKQKIDLARAELDGWPCELEVWRPYWLDVFGTNVQASIGDSCEGAFGRLLKTKTRFDLVPHNVKIAPRNSGLGAVNSNDIWERGGGVCMLDYVRNLSEWQKYDEEGRLVKRGHATQFSEYVWMTNQHAVISARLREAWAKKHGLTLEEAEKRAKELIETIEPSSKNGLRNGLLSGGSLRVRRH